MTFNGFLFLPEMIPSISDKIRAAIIRQSYIDKIERYLGKEIIIALVDQRGVGKECSYNLKPIAAASLRFARTVRTRNKAKSC